MALASRWRSFASLWWGTLFVKIGLSLLLPMSLDECYYWVWGRHPQLSYFDHPGMIGWLYWLGQKLEFIGQWTGGQSARIPGVVLGHLTFLVWNFILHDSLTEKQRKLWLGIVLLSPLWGWGSLIVVPDVPFLFFWSLSILAILRALQTKQLAWYLLLGTFLGLGFCSKYHIVLFVPAALLWIFCDRQTSRVRYLGVALTILSGLIFCAPVLIWNYQNDFVSFKFQLNHGLNGVAPEPLRWVSGYLMSQFFILFPTFAIMAWRNRTQGDLKALKYFAWFPLGFFFLSSFKARGEANWPIAAAPAILALGFLYAKESASRLNWLKGTAALWAVSLIAVLSQIARPWLPISPNLLKTSEFSHFEPLVAAGRDLHPLYGSSYQMASYVSYRLKRDVNKLYGVNRKDFYDFYAPSRPTTEVFYWLIEGDVTLPDWAKNEGYEIIKRTPVSGSMMICEVRKRAKTAYFNFSSFPIFYLPTFRESVPL